MYGLFGSIIKDRLEQMKLTRGEFAKCIGSSGRPVSMYINGDCVPDAITVLYMANTLGISVETLCKALDKDNRGER